MLFRSAAAGKKEKGKKQEKIYGFFRSGGPDHLPDPFRLLAAGHLYLFYLEFSVRILVHQLADMAPGIRFQASAVLHSGYDGKGTKERKKEKEGSVTITQQLRQVCTDLSRVAEEEGILPVIPPVYLFQIPGSPYIRAPLRTSQSIQQDFHPY